MRTLNPTVTVVVDGPEKAAKSSVELRADVFSFGRGGPRLTVDGRTMTPALSGAEEDATQWILRWRFGDLGLTQRFVRETRRRLRVISTLTSAAELDRTVNQVTLFTSNRLTLGPKPARARILEQNAYFGRVRTPRQMLTGSDGLSALDATAGAFISQTHTVLYNPTASSAILIGFETIDRWLPNISARMLDSKTTTASDRVPPFRRFTIGFDGGDYVLRPGESLAAGEFVIEVGTDALDLMDAYGRRIKRRNRLPDPIGPLVNWCSWYPYRLDVTQDLVCSTARVAAQRHLDDLGLRFIQVDLGWAKGNLPTSFEENDRFAAGLGWLATQLRGFGLELGVWVGVLCVADTHPVAHEHPDWLLAGPDGGPLRTGNWYWEPHCPVYALDVSHPGAQAWLTDGFSRLARAGVRYLKFDFAGVVTGKALRGRHDPQFVSAGAREGVRKALALAQDALDSTGEKAVMIDCSGTDHAGAGIAAISYVNTDTGNSGLGWGHLREVYTSYACHLFKHHWALLQPSCLVVGLPGSLEEARVRATATFMGAGHVDIGDDLITLPEDRWSVLLATLPPNDTPARPVDLFEPITTADLTMVPGAKRPTFAEPVVEPEPVGTCVWAMPVQAGWDDWTVVAFFNWTASPAPTDGRLSYGRRMRVDYARVGLTAGATYWAYEFWSGQFLGEIPRAERAPDAYRHDGDFGRLVLESPDDVLDVGFDGPAVKLIVLRQPRPHPWPVGTSFHQSGGRELVDVRWDPSTRTLSGTLCRPCGETGFIAIAGVGGETGDCRLQVTSTGPATPWSHMFKL